MKKFYQQVVKKCPNKRIKYKTFFKLCRIRSLINAQIQIFLKAKIKILLSYYHSNRRSMILQFCV
jgi:hypothetical protein